MIMSSASSSTDNNASSLAELNETVSRLMGHADVEAVQILTRTGDILVTSGGGASQTSSSSATSEASPKQQQQKQLAIVSQQMLDLAHSFFANRDGDDTDDQEQATAFVQLRSKNGQELMIAPHGGYSLVVLKKR